MRRLDLLAWNLYSAEERKKREVEKVLMGSALLQYIARFPGKGSVSKQTLSALTVRVIRLKIKMAAEKARKKR